MGFKQYIKRGIVYLLHGVPERKVYANISYLAPNEMLRGRAALVTGGTSGIGYEIAKAFINAGAKVVITGRNEQKLSKACAAINKEVSCKNMIFGLVMDITKNAVYGFTKGLAKVLAPYGITVNGLAPGPTATPMLMPDGVRDEISFSNSLGRYVLPGEIANMAVFLVSNMGRSIIGDMIFMTGGSGVITYDDVNYSF